MWRGVSHEFGVVRLYRTFSMYIVTGETRSAGCLCNRSGWFKHSEPDRTYSNHNITEIARCGEVCHLSSMCGEVCHRSSGWFDCTEPSLSTSLQGKQGVQGAYALVRKQGVQGAHAIVRGGSSTANLIEPTRNHIITEIARCREVCHMSSGWFDFTEPSLRTSLQGKQGVPGVYAKVRGGSSTSNLTNLLEPQHHRDSKVSRGLSQEFGVV